MCCSAPCFLCIMTDFVCRKMIDFEITKNDILLTRYYQAYEKFDNNFSNFYKNANYVNQRLLCHPEDQSLFSNEECFAFASLKNNCIIKNWDKIINGCKNINIIKKLYDIYYKYHINSIEGVSCNITNKFKQLL